MEIKNSYWEQERVCETKFLEGGPFFLLTTEDLPWLLFETEEDFKEGTNVIAISLAYLPIKLLVDVQMNNHLHLLFEGYQTDVTCFVTRLRKQILAFLHRKGRSLRSWNIQIQPITDFRHFRNAILYVARNPYVAHRNATPLGYRWGSAHLLFNSNIADYSEGQPYVQLTYKAKRQLCHSHNIGLPDTYRVHGGMITRLSFVDYPRTQDFFISANQFFQHLSRKKESDIETARWIGESILLPNDDVFRIVSDWFGVKSITSLPLEKRMEAARRMKAELSSNNKQIAQVLRFPQSQIDALFPVPQ